MNQWSPALPSFLGSGFLSRPLSSVVAVVVIVVGIIAVVIAVVIASLLVGTAIGECSEPPTTSSRSSRRIAHGSSNNSKYCLIGKDQDE